MKMLRFSEAADGQLRELLLYERRRVLEWCNFEEAGLGCIKKQREQSAPQYLSARAFQTLKVVLTSHYKDNLRPIKNTLPETLPST